MKFHIIHLVHAVWIDNNPDKSELSGFRNPLEFKAESGIRIVILPTDINPKRGPWPPPILGIMCIEYAEFILDTSFGPPPILFTFLRFWSQLKGVTFAITECAHRLYGSRDALPIPL